MTQTNSAVANGNQTEKTTWEELRSVIQGRWGELTGEDLDKLKGRVNRLVNLVQERYGLSVEDAKRQVNEFEESLEGRAQTLYKAASEQVSSRYRLARDGMNEFADDVRNFGVGATLANLTRRYPVAITVTAFILGGAIAGASVRRRRRRWY